MPLNVTFEEPVVTEVDKVMYADDMAHSLSFGEPDVTEAGLSYGPNLINNGTFDTDTQWAHDPGMEIRAGRLQTSFFFPFPAFRESENTASIPNATNGYRLEFSVSSISGTWEVYCGSDLVYTFTTTGDKDVTIDPATGGLFRFRNDDGGSVTVVIDDVSVREINP